MLEFFHKSLTTGMNNRVVPSKNQTTPLLAFHCLYRSTLKTRERLQLECGIENFSRPLTHFWKNLFCRLTLTKSNFSVPCLANTKLCWFHFELYKKNMGSRSTKWKKSSILAHKCSLSTKMHETSYKVLN